MNRKEAIRQTHQSNVLQSLGFTADDSYGPRWISKDGTAWVTFFPEGGIFGRPAHFQAYRSVGKPKDHAKPWESDNRRIGREAYGYKTLQEAIDAARGICVY